MAQGPQEEVGGESAGEYEQHDVVYPVSKAAAWNDRRDVQAGANHSVARHQHVAKRKSGQSQVAPARKAAAVRRAAAGAPPQQLCCDCRQVAAQHGVKLAVVLRRPHDAHDHGELQGGTGGME